MVQVVAVRQVIGAFVGLIRGGIPAWHGLPLRPPARPMIRFGNLLRQAAARRTAWRQRRIAAPSDRQRAVGTRRRRGDAQSLRQRRTRALRAHGLFGPTHQDLDLPAAFLAIVFVNWHVRVAPQFPAICRNILRNLAMFRRVAPTETSIEIPTPQVGSPDVLKEVVSAESR